MTIILSSYFGHHRKIGLLMDIISSIDGCG